MNVIAPVEVSFNRNSEDTPDIQVYHPALATAVAAALAATANVSTARVTAQALEVDDRRQRRRQRRLETDDKEDVDFVVTVAFGAAEAELSRAVSLRNSMNSGPLDNVQLNAFWAQFYRTLQLQPLNTYDHYTLPTCSGGECPVEPECAAVSGGGDSLPTE